MGQQGAALMSAVAVSATFASLLTAYLLRRRTTYSEDGKKPVAEEDSPRSLSTVSPTDALDLIQKRRSIFPKQYTGKAVPRHVIEEMLEAARWAPTHHLTEPWHFLVFESAESRASLGVFLAENYKKSAPPSKFLQSKYDKKIKNVAASSYVVAICARITGRCPVVEEVCSVAMAVQNMHLVATAHRVGAYWSSGSIYDPAVPKNKSPETASPLLANPQSLKDFLQFPLTSPVSSNDETPESSVEYVCLGWMFVGDYFDGATEGNGSTTRKSWPQGWRKSLDVEGRLTWR